MKRCLWLGVLTLLSVGSSSEAKPALEFNRDVRPILSDACFACHGPDKAKRKADLRLDTQEGGKGVVEAGKPDESELIKRVISQDDSIHMPPKKSGRRLTAGQIETLREWIRQG